MIETVTEVSKYTFDITSKNQLIIYALEVHIITAII